ncbi:AAA family ATPase [Rugamonas sp. DEMB1]|uniref:AAA family ATPase n=1 Tax=Rugamonas sp. DEMB1 TaxID=3039386 RepID=UPI00244C151B|nr:AAA family ATPase [Rugamonas sp. DEMB1]WGG50317.1 AAA family ATPase [Rugamonas sp. DEMB1]
MSLLRFKYKEYKNDPRAWELKDCEFNTINLVVGLNSTGKSRLVSVINSLVRILTGLQSSAFESGRYDASISMNGKIFDFHIEFDKKVVVSEKLMVDGVLKLQRNANGSGKIYYEQQKSFIDFEMTNTTSVIQQKVDALQHPFVKDLYDWAMGVQTYWFNSSFANNLMIPLSLLNSGGNNEFGENVVNSYSKAFEKFGADFDKAIIRDMKKLGYSLSDVGVDDLRRLNPAIQNSEPILCVFVTERGRPAISSERMSQGMFRALALIININAAALAKNKTMVLIDDIGEGLDYERSVSLIDLLTFHAKKSDIQVIMTTNDRFVMNRIPLEFWMILQRSKHIVRSFTERNRPEEFREFRYMGLSNFDFFTSAKFSLG